MTEILAQSSKIEKRNTISPEELEAIKAINKLFSEEKGNDLAIKKSLEQGTAEKTIQEHYDLIKNDLTFTQAYTPEQYNKQKGKVTDYIQKEFLDQGRKGLSFSSLHPLVLESKLYNYNMTNGYTSKNIVDISKFMTNFKAEYIQTSIYMKEVIRPIITPTGYEKDQTHDIGKIFEIPPKEKSHIQNLARQAGENTDMFYLNVFGQADATEVKNPEFIGPKYNQLRSKLMQGFKKQEDADIIHNINKVFPEFNKETYPDKASWNLAFAKARAMSKISFLDLVDKKILMKGAFISSDEDNKVQIGHINFKFNIASVEGKDNTIGRVELLPHFPTRKEQISKYLENYIQNQNFPTLTFTIYDDIKSKPTQPYIIPWKSIKSSNSINAPFNISTAADSGKKENPGLITSNTEPNKQALIERSGIQGSYIMNIVISHKDILDGAYDDILSYEIDTDTHQAKNIVFKKAMSFDDALHIYMNINKNNPSIMDYTEQVSAAVNNFKLLADEIQRDPQLKAGIASDLYNKVKENSGKYTVDSIKNDPYYKYLEQLGIDIKPAKTVDGKDRLLFSIADKKLILDLRNKTG